MKHYVTCLTTSTYLGEFNSELKANQAIKNHCLKSNPNHKFKVIIEQNNLSITNQIFFKEDRYRVVCPKKNYNSNWSLNKNDIFQKLLIFQKKYPKQESFVIEEKQILIK